MQAAPGHFGLAGINFPWHFHPRLVDQLAVSPVHFGLRGFNFPWAPAVTGGEGTLTHSPADVLRHLLVAAGQGTLPESNGAWPVHVGEEPAKPDNCLTLYDTAGRLYGKAMFTGDVLEQFGVQIRVRARGHAAGWAKAAELTRLVDRGLYRTLVGVEGAHYFVGSVTRAGGIFSLGKEPPANRVLFTINLLVELAKATTS